MFTKRYLFFFNVCYFLGHQRIRLHKIITYLNFGKSLLQSD